MELKSGRIITDDEVQHFEMVVRKISVDYTCRMASKDSGFSKSTLHRAYLRLQNGEEIVVGRGRKPIIPKNIVKSIGTEQDFNDLAKNSMDEIQFKEAVEAKIHAANEADPNTPVRLVELNVSKRTLKRNLLEALPEVVETPSVQNKRRMEALCDSKNGISLAASWCALIGGDDLTGVVGTLGVINPELVYNIDSTALRVGSEVKKKVYLRKGSKDKLKKLNLSVGYTKKKESETYQQRTMHLVSVTSASGRLPCAVVKIKDKKAKHIIVAPIQLHKLYLMIIPCSCDDNEVTKVLYESCIIPSICADRERIFSEMPIVTGQSQSDAPESQTVPTKASDLRAVLTLDGELPQIKFIMENIDVKSFNIEFFKFSAACSPSQQPNDAMKSFVIVKSLERSLRDADIAAPSWLQALADKFKRHGYFAPSSERTVLRFLRHLPTILSRAYTVPIVQDGWRVTGLFPYQPIRILEHWPFYDQLTKVESRELLDKVTELAYVVKEQGMLTEDQLDNATKHIVEAATDRVLERVPELKQLSFKRESNEEEEEDSESGSDNEETSNNDRGDIVTAHRPSDSASSAVGKRKKQRKSLNEKPVSYQRCVWLNNDAFVAAYNERKRVAQLEKDAQDAERERKAQRKAEKQQERVATEQRKVARIMEQQKKQQLQQVTKQSAPAQRKKTTVPDKESAVTSSSSSSSSSNTIAVIARDRNENKREVKAKQLMNL